MKHEPDCGCLTCYQALRKFRDEANGLVEKYRRCAAGWPPGTKGEALFLSVAQEMEALIEASKNRVA